MASIPSTANFIRISFDIYYRQKPPSSDFFLSPSHSLPLSQHRCQLSSSRSFETTPNSLLNPLPIEFRFYSITFDLSITNSLSIPGNFPSDYLRIKASRDQFRSFDAAVLSQTERNRRKQTLVEYPKCKGRRVKGMIFKASLKERYEEKALDGSVATR